MLEETITEEQQRPGAQPEADPIPPTTVDSTLAGSTLVSTQEPPEEEAQGSRNETLSPQKRVFLPNWSNIIACLLFLILVGEHLVPLIWPALDSFLHPKAVVTLFAAKQPLSFTYTFVAVTGTTDRVQQQIPSRVLNVTTSTKSVPIHTTGIGYTPAIHAKGEVTFYNAAIYSQIIAAETVITGNDGIQIVTDETVTVGAGNPPYSYGIASTPAHSLQAGTVGNIQALDINGLCCLAGISVKNTRSFTGGNDPKAYPTVSTADLQAAAHQVASVLDPVARNSVQSQIEDTERVLIPVQCSYTTASNPKIGERATEAMVSVSETCKVQVYDDETLQELARMQFAADAEKALHWGVVQGNSFALTLAKPLLLDSSHHTYKLAVTMSGTMIFHLSETQLHSLVTRIIGKKITEAQRVLLAIKGVQGVSITPAHPEESTLPTDPGRIHLLVSA